ncbi:unnamed protein product, partial [Discosporangium mesarthrocarpum]
MMTIPTWGTHNGSSAVRRNCDYCVRKKVKCSGTSPCIMCQRKSLQCIYSVKKKPGPKSRKREGDWSPLNRPLNAPNTNTDAASPITRASPRRRGRDRERGAGAG